MNVDRYGIMSLHSYGQPSMIVGMHAGGTSVAPGETFTNDTMLSIAARARDGGGYLAQNSAEIRFVAQDSGSSSNAGAIRFMTSDGGPLTNRMVIDEQGNVGFGTTTPQVALDASSASDGFALPAGVELEIALESMV
jgi:hypothetical protein